MVVVVFKKVRRVSIDTGGMARMERPVLFSLTMKGVVHVVRLWQSVFGVRSYLVRLRSVVERRAVAWLIVVMVILCSVQATGMSSTGLAIRCAGELVIVTACLGSCGPIVSCIWHAPGVEALFVRAIARDLVRWLSTETIWISEGLLERSCFLAFSKSFVILLVSKFRIIIVARRVFALPVCGRRTNLHAFVECCSLTLAILPEVRAQG